MSVRRGPTERRRSEDIPTQEEPSQEQTPLVTWGVFPSNSPKAKQSAPRQTLFPAKAGPTEATAYPRGTGFSREAFDPL
jgi:hypothetical protein